MYCNVIGIKFGTYKGLFYCFWRPKTWNQRFENWIKIETVSLITAARQKGFWWKWPDFSPDFYRRSPQSVFWGIIINIHRGTSWEELLLDWARKPGGWCSVATGTVMISRSGLSAASTEPVPSKPITKIPGLKPEKNFRPKLNQLLVIVLMVSQSASWPEFFGLKLLQKFGIFIKKSWNFRVILPRKIWVLTQIETPSVS